jgi:hypothetical protein
METTSTVAMTEDISFPVRVSILGGASHGIVTVFNLPTFATIKYFKDLIEQVYKVQIARLILGNKDIANIKAYLIDELRRHGTPSSSHPNSNSNSNPKTIVVIDHACLLKGDRASLEEWEIVWRETGIITISLPGESNHWCEICGSHFRNLAMGSVPMGVWAPSCSISYRFICGCHFHFECFYNDPASRSQSSPNQPICPRCGKDLYGLLRTPTNPSIS